MAKEKPRSRWRLGLRLAGWSLLFVSTALAAREARRLLATDQRFVYTGNITVEGIAHASRARVLRVFASDSGRSLLLLPIDERRRRLLAIDWVEDAMVARIWPNQVLVRLRERTPVAFVSLRQHGSTARIGLIDAQGVLLEQPPKAGFTFPVLIGIAEEQSEAERRIRVGSMLQLMEDLGPLGKNVSEVDASTPENLKIIAQVEGRAVKLVLGDTNFARRLQNFLNHYPEIQKRSGRGTIFDLRLDDRITAKDE